MAAELKRHHRSPRKKNPEQHHPWALPDSRDVPGASRSADGDPVGRRPAVLPRREERNVQGDLCRPIGEVEEAYIRSFKTIDRGGGFVLPPAIHLEVYKEAFLIFYGKASVYLKAMEKDEPEQWRQWIA